MSGNHTINNRNSTPDANMPSSLRPPTTKAVGSGANLRASADLGSMHPVSATSRIRPSSDFYGQSQQGQSNLTGDLDPQDTLAQQWIADIDQYETTLEEMAAATLDQDFKDELSAIEQWFRVLSEAERTAALYALLQQTTQVQIRFFIQVLQQMGKNHPMSGVLSPVTFEKDPMSSRLSDAMNKLNVDSSRNSIARPAAAAASGTKRQSGLDPSTINAMFPDAAAAIATEKAKFTQQTGNPPMSNRNSAAGDQRIPSNAPTITAPDDTSASGQNPSWISNNNQVDSRPPSSQAGQAPMGHFVQPPSGLRSPRPPQLNSNTAIQSTTITTTDKSSSDIPLLSPYTAGSSGNWASMVNTPMVANFNNSSGTQAEMVANATAMKLAALSTVNNRFALDDVRKYRRTRSNDTTSNQGQNPLSPQGKIPGLLINEHRHMFSREQATGLPQQTPSTSFGHRSRPSSPGLAIQGPNGSGFGQISFTSPQNNGFLSAYDNSTPLINALPTVNLSNLGLHPPEGYLSDHSDMARGRSPRGRRGSSKPPEDPTDPSLLEDIPAWLRSLRLHKYTENLKELKWTELIELDDKQLEERGVNALGARRKMLKVFQQVKDARAEGKLR